MINTYLNKFTNLILDMFFPNHCLLCNRILYSSKNNPKSLCINCVKRNLDYIHISGYSLCKRCGSIIDSETSRCEKCIDKTLYFNGVMAMLFYSDNTKKLILNMKFAHRYFICHDFAYMLINFYKDYIKNHDIIISVPIGKQRFKERGYNQSEIMVRVIANKLKIEFYKDIIYRKRETVSLSSAKNTEERINIIKNVFVLDDKNKKYLENKRVLIIDDVFTTGTTVNEMSKLLMKEGLCKEINILTVAKTH